MTEPISTHLQSLVRTLKGFGCGEFDLVLQTDYRRKRGESIVALATECAAFVTPIGRSEKRRLLAGGYTSRDNVFVRPNLTDVFQEAVAISQFRFPKRSPEVRRIQLNDDFRTPWFELERLPGIWKSVEFTSFRKDAPGTLYTILVKRRRGRWRRPPHLRILDIKANSDLRRTQIPISDAWEIDLDALRAESS